MNGLLIVDKPKDMTSRDVVNKLNRIFNTKKIGHTGTLDPLATGVLVICIGKYTKLVDTITSSDKEYIAKVKLGIKTDTGDITGNIIEEKKFLVNEENFIKALTHFKGSYEQTVPIYSAIKINGKKLYEYAREGIDVELPKRIVNVSDISLINITDHGFEFKCTVSKGTYIRSLIEDICDYLDMVGTMESLRRTKQGNFDISNSFSLENIENDNYSFISLEDALSYPKYNLTDEEYFKVKNGAKLNIDIINGNYFMVYQEEIIAIYNFENNLGKVDVML